MYSSRDTSVVSLNDEENQMIYEDISEREARINIPKLQIRKRKGENSQDARGDEEDLNSLGSKRQHRNDLNLKKPSEIRISKNQHKDSPVPNSSESTDTEWKEIHKRNTRRTYAQISKSGKSNKNNINTPIPGSEKLEGRVVIPGDNGWNTPPPTTNIDNAIIITSKTEHNTRKFANELATSINNKSIEGPLGVRLIKDGKLMIIPKDQNQYNKIRENLQNLNNIEIREKHKSEPVFIITGIEKGLTNEDFIAKIIRNDCLQNFNSHDFQIVKRLKKGKLDIDCQLHYAEEYLALAICYNCCRFGHVLKYCTEKNVCSNCTENHNARDCKSETLKCINCWRMNGQINHHSASDLTCPPFQSALNKSRKNDII
ncbi:hypothetical protein NQ317_001894 [Molorchus minor]|uniref:CCHC-type domain-containing protein n=1 Tax=Molorchus minor TaxID=1323400 RepID=A0ABQ9IZN5_9CUCU|nr:hypothetical protein NQ317_001894 [Molorchus minor]